MKRNTGFSAEGNKRKDTPEDPKRRKVERSLESRLEDEGWKAKQNLRLAYERTTGKIESWSEGVMGSIIEKVLRSLSSTERKEATQKTRLGARTYYSPHVVEMIFDELDGSKHNPRNKRK